MYKLSIQKCKFNLNRYVITLNWNKLYICSTSNSTSFIKKLNIDNEFFLELAKKYNTGRKKNIAYFKKKDALAIKKELQPFVVAAILTKII